MQSLKEQNHFHFDLPYSLHDNLRDLQLLLDEAIPNLIQQPQIVCGLRKCAQHLGPHSL